MADTVINVFASVALAIVLISAMIVLAALVFGFSVRGLQALVQWLVRMFK